ncbi:MAG: RagB/SusD family nutrient uptake outer membrane protein [Prevotella sp.]|nr:RagB/SusD family nutrient uptake outer membrane protein [Prevotella sp.]
MFKRIYKAKLWMAAGLLSIMGLSACNDYLEVVPDDGNAELSMAFNLRSTAIRYLGTCYSFMPSDGVPGSDPAQLGGDEYCDLFERVTSTTRVPKTMTYIARGYQNSSSVYANDWNNMYVGIRDCDILIDNVDQVPDMEQSEKDQWKAEAKFLKAYYHFHLIRKWGAIPLVRKSLPMDADVDQVRVYRDPIDSCFNFVLQQLDEAIPYLAESFDVTEYGRITQSAAKAFKAKVACFAASPLFNGNENQAKLVDNRGVQLFPAKSEEQKLERWRYAVDACADAIEACHKANIKLYEGEDIIYRMNDTLRTDLILRGTLCENWNSEVVWGNSQTGTNTLWQVMACVNLQYRDNTSLTSSLTGWRFIGVPMKIAEEFYTRNGLPIAYDKEWKDVSPLDLKQGDEDHQFYLEQGYVTCALNFNREPRFYSSLGFDGGKWLGALTETEYNDLVASKVYDVECRMGKYACKTSSETGPTTGYFPKKTFPYRNRVTGNGSQISVTYFAWPIIRLADLYLLYAEAINEAEGPNGAHSADLFAYIDAVRKRAGIPGVKEAWDTYSTAGTGYYNNQTNMRAIIHQERMNELLFESQRFWDLRRWMEAPSEYGKNCYGFNIQASDPADYYKKVLVYEQPFTQKDYFWPISRYNLERNKNLVQNLGWTE